MIEHPKTYLAKLCCINCGKHFTKDVPVGVEINESNVENCVFLGNHKFVHCPFCECTTIIKEAK